jgi:anti-anti-sigma regulatory factor
MQFARPPAGLLVDFEEAPPALYVDLVGYVDVATARHLDIPSHVRLSEVTMILLDLRQVDFCDGSGIRALIDLRREQLRSGRQVWITRIRVPERHLLELVGVARDFLQ